MPLLTAIDIVLPGRVTSPLHCSHFLHFLYLPMAEP